MSSDINMYLGREKAGIMRKRAHLLRKGCSFEITRALPWSCTAPTRSKSIWPCTSHGETSRCN